MTGMALEKLIDAAMAANPDWSYRSLEKYAREHGYNLGRSDILNARSGTATLVPEKLIALAFALHLPAYQVAVAALADHGIEIPVDTHTPEEAISRDPTLPPEVRRALLLLIENARRSSG